MKKLKTSRKILLLTSVAVIFLSGCIGQEGEGEIQYKDDIITIGEYTVDNINPYERSLTTISFLIQNNGDRLEGVDVDISFNIDPFTVEKLVCDFDEVTAPTDGVYMCELNDIVSLDFRQVAITLRAPEVEESTSFPISYTIKYHYNGYRKADIPLIDGTTIRRPMGKYSQSEPSYGPIELIFEPPVGSSHKEDSKIIKEYWGILGRPFEVKMNFRHVGSGSVGVVSPTTIHEGDVKLILSPNIERVRELTCHFSGSGEQLISNRNITIPKGKAELTCNFQTIEITPPESLATITAEFEYDYEYTRTESFTVEPVEEES